MSRQQQHRRGSSIGRSAALATGVIAALAIAAPVAEASAATTLAVPPPAVAGHAAVNLPVMSLAEPSAEPAAVAIGPTIIGSVFNGGTTVVVSTGPAIGTTLGSP
jgi:hypothetical protein